MQRGKKKRKKKGFQLFLILFLMTSLCSSFPSSQNTPFSCPLYTSSSSHSVTSELPWEAPPPTSDVGIAQPFSLATFRKLFYDFFLNNSMFSMTFHPLMASKFIYLAWNFLWLQSLYIDSILVIPCLLSHRQHRHNLSKAECNLCYHSQPPPSQ